MRYKCDCCGYYSLNNYSDEICHVCGWQEDNVQRRYPDFTGGANENSLNEAKKNYRMFGVFDLEYIDEVRKPYPEELPENNR